MTEPDLSSFFRAMDAASEALRAASAALNASAIALQAKAPPSDFWKGPAGGIVIAFFGIVMKDWFDRWTGRRRTLRAMLTETESSFGAVHDLMSRFPKKAEASAVVAAAEKGEVGFEVLDKLVSGWVLYVPSFPVSELVTRLSSTQAHAALRYFDAWTRLTELERRYSATFAKLVDATGKKDAPVPLRELSVQVKDCLGQLRNAGLDLCARTKELEYEAKRGLHLVPDRAYSYFSPHKPPAFSYAEDWAPQKPAPAPTAEA